MALGELTQCKQINNREIKQQRPNRNSVKNEANTLAGDDKAVGGL